MNSGSHHFYSQKINNNMACCLNQLGGCNVESIVIINELARYKRDGGGLYQGLQKVQ